MREFSIRKYKTIIRKGSGSGAVPAAPAPGPGPFCYASVCKLSKHRCCSCGAPIRSVSIRRVVLCPVCGSRNKLK